MLCVCVCMLFSVCVGVCVCVCVHAFFCLFRCMCVCVCVCILFSVCVYRGRLSRIHRVELGASACSHRASRGGSGLRPSRDARMQIGSASRCRGVMGLALTRTHV